MNTAVIRLTLVLLLGICTGFYLEWSLKMAFLTLLPVLFLFLFAFVRARKLLFPDMFFGSCVFLLFFSLGIFVTSLHLPQNQPWHYLNKISSEENPLLKLKVKESLKADLFNEKYIAEVLLLNNTPSEGQILLLRPKDSLKTPFLEGEEIAASAAPEAIPAPLNPHQFDYSRFMSRKGIYRQLVLKEDLYEKHKTEAAGIKFAASQLRNKITAALRKKNFGSEELAVVQALLLGQKQDISTETYNNFAAAGAIHILAVSGLHVGIILLILNRIFSPLKRFKNGKIIKTFLVILSLWGFAVLAGLSPSVVRAVTMFSFIAVGLTLNRRTSTLNSVFLSLLLLLLVRPQWIFEVGFQLSYSAVLAIVLFQPLLSGLYRPSNKIGKYVWDLLTVTIAAQVGVLPLSLYYFHQFPGLFFLSNLLILPFLGFILIFGVLVIVLALLGVLPPAVAKIYEGVIESLNSIVAIIARQEQFLFKDISFSVAEVSGWYFFIICFLLVWKYFSYRKLVLFLFSVVVLQGIYLSNSLTSANQLIIFQKSRSTLLAKAEKDQLQLYHQNKTSLKDLNIVKNYGVGEGLGKITEKPLKNIYRQKRQILILLDSTGILPSQIPQNSKLLLTGSPRVNLERVLEQVKPSAVIADGSNYKTLVQRWKETAYENNIPFHYTGEDGACFIK